MNAKRLTGSVALRRWLVLVLLATGLGGLAAAELASSPAAARADASTDVEADADADGDAGADTGVSQAPPPVPGAADGDADAAPDADAVPAPAPGVRPGAPGTGNVLPRNADVAIIHIEGMIYGFTFESLQRRVDRALADGASIIVIELDTPGGRVDTALHISKYLKALNVPTVAWVNNEAYSAGILIASAADQIVMSPASATGDAAPIVPGQELSPTERAKALSPILEEFRDNARANNYDFALFHAMVVLGVEVYYVEHRDTGERRLVNQADYAVMVRDMDIDAANREVRGQHSGGWLSGITGGRQQAQPLDVAMPSVEIATPQDRGRWRAVTELPSGATISEGRVHDGRTLLTLSQSRALDIGLSRATIGNEGELATHLGASSVFRVDQTWSENLAGFLVHPVVRGVLILALLLGAYIEFQTPGIGVAGAVAGLALITLLGAPLVVGLAEIWHILLVVLGLALLLVELAFLPGFGLLGVAGLAMMFIGLVLSAVPTGGGALPGLPPAEMWDQVLLSALWLLLGTIGAIFAIYFVARHFGNVPILNRLVLQATQQPALAGAAGAAVQPELPVSGDETLGEGRIRVGDAGTVTTGLRPSGRAEIKGQIVDVVSHGQWIAPGQRVRVVEIHGNRIVVDAEE